MVTLSLPMMFGLVALVVDVGWAYWRQEACKTAAQSAAEAAGRAAQLASNLTCGSGVACAATTTNCPSSPTSPPSNNLIAGCLYAQVNGYTSGGNNSRQNVSYSAGTSNNPVSGNTANYWVRFTVVEKIPALFISVLGVNFVTVSANATSGVYGGSPGGCVYVLAPPPNNGWTMSGGTFSTGCGIKVNGAAVMSGGIITLGSGNSSSTTYMNVRSTMTQSGGIINPSSNLLANTGVTYSDPISGLTAPTAGTCLPNPNISGGIGTVIPAGTYCSGISISGGVNLQLGSGIFDITGGSFTVSGGNLTTASGGATLYFGPSAGNLSVSGGNLTLTAITGGTTDGVAIWKDGTNLSSAAISGSNTTINGIIYMPHTALSYSGGNTPVNQTIVAYTLAMSGGNISQPGTSSYQNNGGINAGTYLIQ